MIDDAVDVPENEAAVCSAEDIEGAVAVEDSTDDGVEYEADANVPKDNPVKILRARMLWKILRPRLLPKISRAMLLLKIPRARLFRKILRERLMQVILLTMMAWRILGMWLKILGAPKRLLRKTLRMPNRRR